MAENRTPPALDADALLERTTRALTDLRFDVERQLGRILAELHYHQRQIEKQRRAEAARAERERGAR